MQIAGLQKTTLVDFPGKIAATVFTRGCSFRCPFCHNPELVLPDQFIPLMNEDEVMTFFENRKNQLHGVCITGGEPTMQKDLPQFLQKLKDMGYAIKLDSNGSYPEILDSIITTGNIDYIAMDIKTTLEKYASVANPKSEILNSKQILNQNDQNRKPNIVDCHSEPQAKNLAERIKKSIDLIMSSGIDYEFRTTVCHPIHEVSDFEEIGRLIKGAKRYYIQNFVKSKHNDETIKFESFTDEELAEAKKIISRFVKNSCVR